MYAFLPTYHCLIFVPFIERPTVKIKAIWKLIANKDFENNYGINMEYGRRTSRWIVPSPLKFELQKTNFRDSSQSK